MTNQKRQKKIARAKKIKQNKPAKKDYELCKKYADFIQGLLGEKVGVVRRSDGLYYIKLSPSAQAKAEKVRRYQDLLKIKTKTEDEQKELAQIIEDIPNIQKLSFSLQDTFSQITSYNKSLIERAGSEDAILRLRV